MLCTFFITTTLEHDISKVLEKQEGLELQGPHYLLVYAANVNFWAKPKHHVKKYRRSTIH
jgi:hypothetical protein